MESFLKNVWFVFVRFILGYFENNSCNFINDIVYVFKLNLWLIIGKYVCMCLKLIIYILY